MKLTTRSPGEAGTSACSDSKVAIIGGGPAGACCALALRQCGIRRVCMIEADGHDQFRIGESLAPESRRLMQQLGIWSAFLAEGHEPCYGSCSWWGDERRGYNDNLLNPLGHGWHLDRARFNRFLAEQVRKARVRLLTQYRFTHVRPDADGGFLLQVVHENRPQYINADFVVDASGARATFAKLQGVHKQFLSSLICSSRVYQLSAADDPLGGLTHLEAVASGWWYAAKLPDDKLIVSHTTDAETFRELGLKHTAEWEQELSRSPNTSSLVEKAAAITQYPEVHSATSFILDKVVGDDWLAIGDAASSYDPITSQGIVKSMSDGINAAQCIARFLREKDPAALMAYKSAVNERYRAYRQVVAYFYKLETRFQKHTFWRKMHELHDMVCTEDLSN